MNLRNLLFRLIVMSLVTFNFLTGCESLDPFSEIDIPERTHNIYIMDLNGSVPQNLSNKTDDNRLLDISPLGSKIIFESKSGNFQLYKSIWTMNIDGSNKDCLFQGNYLQFSPDESMVVYIYQTLSEKKILIGNSNGYNNISIVSNLGGYLVGPKFSPDGSKIVYANNDSLFIINIDGSNQEYLTNGASPQYTPDGSRIVFYSTTTLDLYSVRIDGTDMTNITNGSGSNFQYVISPDGSKIVYGVQFGNLIGDYELCIVNIDGSNKKILTEFTSPYAETYNINFSPDGSKLLFCGLENGEYEIYEMNIDGSNKKNLSSNIFADCKAAEYASNGNKIIVEIFKLMK